MRIKETPTDFVVVEKLGPELARAGDFSIYRVEKENVTTAQARLSLAQALQYPASAIQFPGLKDKRSVATQYASIKGNPPPRIEARHVRAKWVGRLDRPLGPTDIAANHFTITIRDLAPRRAATLRRGLTRIARQGVPNYFDKQRFGSYHPQLGFIGGHILARDAQAALNAYLVTPYPADPPETKAFKQLAADHWGDWALLFDAAPRPSNYRSLLTFLRDHPENYRKALNLIPRQTLSLFLSAYQSALWNRLVGRVLSDQLADADLTWIKIAGSRLPVYRHLPESLAASWRTWQVAMPNHQARYERPELANAMQVVLEQEGISLHDLKARILQKAYLGRHLRPMLVVPRQFTVQQPAADERFAGRQKLVVAMTLPRGSYATLVIDCAVLE